jgi:hypothetical protein
MVTASSNSRRSFVQTFMFWAFRLATYFVLACATYIFLEIAIKGSRTVFTNHAPFINVKFLTEPPQTLYVFDYQGKKMELSDREFRKWQETHKEPVDATSIAYSAGGIWPCIVGTALLVIGSMIVALVIGISAAIYLSEYSRETRFIQFIRVAILNLAGYLLKSDGTLGEYFIETYGQTFKMQKLEENVFAYSVPAAPQELARLGAANVLSAQHTLIKVVTFEQGVETHNISRLTTVRWKDTSSGKERTTQFISLQGRHQRQRN